MIGNRARKAVFLVSTILEGVGTAFILSLVVMIIEDCRLGEGVYSPVAAHLIIGPCSFIGGLTAGFCTAFVIRRHGQELNVASNAFAAALVSAAAASIMRGSVAASSPMLFAADAILLAACPVLARKLFPVFRESRPRSAHGR